MQLQQPFITFRLQDVRGKDKRIEIQVDGESVGELGVFEEFQIPVTMGRHLITSNSFWNSRAYPIEIEISEGDEEIEITLEPVDNKNKYQFYVETRIPSSLQFSDANLKSRKLTWDMEREVFVRKINDSCLYFDLRNKAYLYPLHFEFDIYNHSMKVYANRKQKVVLYESRVDYVDPSEVVDYKNDNFKKHSFYREDGTLLGHLFKENEKWFISAADMHERLAEICDTNILGDMFVNKDHYLVSLESDHRVLSYKKWNRRNYLNFRSSFIPNPDHQEILMLAFITFSTLSRDYSFLYNSDLSGDSVHNKPTELVKSLV